MTIAQLKHRIAVIKDQIKVVNAEYKKASASYKRSITNFNRVVNTGDKPITPAMRKKINDAIIREEKCLTKCTELIGEKYRYEKEVEELKKKLYIAELKAKAGRK